MTIDEQINSAIGAHGLWKGRLRAAINSGNSDLSVSVVRDDHQCAFGKWLNGADIDAGMKSSKHYGACVELHRRFHGAAADVLALAIAGKKEAASHALGRDQAFGKLSAELIRTLMECLAGFSAHAR